MGNTVNMNCFFLLQPRDVELLEVEALRVKAAAGENVSG